MFFSKKKKVEEKKEEYKEPFAIPQIPKEIVGLKKKKDSFTNTGFTSPIFGRSVKDETSIPDVHGLGDTIRQYDAFRDEKDKKLSKNYDEFSTMVVNNRTRAEIFGSDVVIKEKEEIKKEKTIEPQIDIPFSLGKDEPKKSPVENYKPYQPSSEIKSSDFNLNFLEKEEQAQQPETEKMGSEKNDFFNATAFQTDFFTNIEETVPEFQTTYIPKNDFSKQEKNVNTAYIKNEPQKPEAVFTSSFDEEPKNKTTVVKTKSIYRLPPVSLLKKKDFDRYSKPEWVDDQIEIINNTLRQFDIDGSIVNYTKGPSVTRYEVKLSPGVNVKKVTAIEDNIKMNLSAKTIRIEAPIPGKSTVGIEVPNIICEDVAFGNVCDTDEFRNSSPLNVGIGLDISGRTIYSNIAKMPHGLIAGATGSGKSVCINTIIVSLLLKNSPDDLKLMLIDPKVVELVCYDDLPHLITPVISEPKMAAQGLKWSVDEMERRYRLFADMRVRNLSDYNEKIKSYEGMEKMPYIVIVIDELADLMLAASQDVEDAIKRLTAKSRAAGIHLLVATQRPTTDVIKGTIKANIPSRIAFKVSSFTDSITILDYSGAENLLGRGDMFIRQDDSTIRVQGAFVSDSEIDAVCEYIRAESAPNYLFSHDSLQVAASKREIDDELFPDIARFVVENEAASINRIQKEFNIGFNRAQKIFDMLVEQGVVSSGQGGRPRDILMSISQVEELIGKE